VLIYFDAPTKKAILQEIRETLYRGGYLVLGASETSVIQDAGYQREVLGDATFFRVV